MSWTLNQYLPPARFLLSHSKEAFHRATVGASKDFLLHPWMLCGQLAWHWDIRGLEAKQSPRTPRLWRSPYRNGIVLFQNLPLWRRQLKTSYPHVEGWWGKSSESRGWLSLLLWPCWSWADSFSRTSWAMHSYCHAQLAPSVPEM